MPKLFEGILYWRAMRAFQALPSQSRKIVFYAETKNDWTYFENVIEEILKSNSATICYVTSDPDDPILESSRTGIFPICIGSGSIRTIFFRMLSAEVVVMTLPDLETFFLLRSAEVSKYVYIFHSVNSTHMAYLPAALDHYDSILCVGPHQIEEIRAREVTKNLPAKTLIESGYPRLDNLIESSSNMPAPAPYGKGRRILLAPTWGETGILETIGEELIGSLSNGDDLVTVRPHPMTRRNSPDCITRLLNLYSDKDNIEFEQDLTGSLSLQEAHILITDWSGIGYEFAFALERPVLYVDTPPKCRNEEYTKTQIEPLEFRIRKMVGDVLKPEDIDQAGVYIDRLCEAPEKMAQKIRKVRAQTMFNVGKSAKISADHIINLRSD